MAAPDEILNNWHGIIDNDFLKTVRETFAIPDDDTYVYRANPFAMTFLQIESELAEGGKKYKYQQNGKLIEVPPADITAYTSIFSPTTDTSKALTALSSNAKKGSPRETVAHYLLSRRICPTKIPKSKNHVNPYYNLWAESCQLTAFLGPLSGAAYADPRSAAVSHPILPLFYHHFGCVVPTYEALYIISEMVKEQKADGVIDMASGNGYWTYMLRRMAVDVKAVDKMQSTYRTMWISDTVNKDGVEFLKQNQGGKGRILLMVYMVTAGNFTKRVLQAYQGDTIVVVGTQNANRYTDFADCTTEQYFEKEMSGWEMTYRIAMPSFAGKDEGMYVWMRKK